MSDYNIFRCQTCGRLLTDKMIRQGICEGHRMVYASRGTLAEWITIKFRLKVMEPLGDWWTKRKG